MPLDTGVRNRVVLLGGKVGGVDCPDCEFRSLDVELDPVDPTDVVCPECGTTILTAEQHAQLREAGKL